VEVAIKEGQPYNHWLQCKRYVVDAIDYTNDVVGQGKLHGPVNQPPNRRLLACHSIADRRYNPLDRYTKRLNGGERLQITNIKPVAPERMPPD
jgi:hypothetical protein